MKVLNLYAGIGGNRKLWEDVEVTAVEWDEQFIIGDYYNFVHGPVRIKDNLQSVVIKARKYFCDTEVVEAPVIVPSVFPYEITIPEVSDPNFRDLDANDIVTEVWEGSTPYTLYINGGTFSAITSYDVITTGVDIATGTPLILLDNSIYDIAQPLETSVFYYAIRYSATQSRLATTYANAMDGIYIDITTTGFKTGTIQYYQIVTPTQGTYRHDTRGVFKFSAADAGKNLTLTYTYTKFTT